MRVVDLPAARTATIRALRHRDPQEGEDPADVADEMRLWDVAELFWVTEEMTRVALDASRDMPPWSLELVIPAEVGVIYYDGGLPALPIANVADADADVDTFGRRRLPTLPVDYFLWWRSGVKLRVSYGCRVQRAVARFTVPPRQPFISMGIIDFPDVTQVMDTRVRDLDPDDEMGQLKVNVIMALGATWTMMRQENVAETPRRMVHPSSKQRRAGTPPTSVTIVTLRRLRTIETREDDSGRRLKYRHIVRGHWRQQACGPNHSQRRPVWIPSYIKGPDGAPLVRTDRVMVWRR